MSQVFASYVPQYSGFLWRREDDEEKCGVTKYGEILGLMDRDLKWTMGNVFTQS
jgi:hypothetical protein